MAENEKRQGLTVVITGASSGFGKGVARQLAADGANVVLAARRTALIEELAAELGERAIAVTTDVSKEKDVKQLFETALAAFGKIDVWINNAAVGAIGPYTEVPGKDMARAVEINVIGTLIGSHYALRQFKQQGHGTLINIGSVAGKVPFPYYTPYSTTKFAVIGLTASLYQEIELGGHKDIHVCIVHPWATDTPWFLHTANYTGHEAEMKPMDDPKPVIDAIISLIDEPQESIEVGSKVKGTALSRSIMPKLTEKMNSGQVKGVIEDAPPAPPTAGSLHEPLEIGTEVSGGIRKRMKLED
jgi:short-subunit dehydrogenase